MSQFQWYSNVRKLNFEHLRACGPFKSWFTMSWPQVLIIGKYQQQNSRIHPLDLPAKLLMSKITKCTLSAYLGCWIHSRQAQCSKSHKFNIVNSAPPNLTLSCSFINRSDWSTIDTRMVEDTRKALLSVYHYNPKLDVLGDNNVGSRESGWMMW
jgi:hypothetical protein